MSSHTTTNQTLDLTAFINANVEQQTKIAQAVDAARKAHAETIRLNSIKQKAANQTVSMIQKETAKSLASAKIAQEEAYKKTMCDLGLSAQVYPMETALVAVDKKVMSKLFGSIGKVGKFFAGVGQYIGNRTTAGFKS